MRETFIVLVATGVLTSLAPMSAHAQGLSISVPQGDLYVREYWPGPRGHLLAGPQAVTKADTALVPTRKKSKTNSAR